LNLLKSPAGKDKGYAFKEPMPQGTTTRILTVSIQEGNIFYFEYGRVSIFWTEDAAEFVDAGSGGAIGA